jgi:hypothetical protein
LKCDKCGYISFDYSMTCPSCNKSLAETRRRLGSYLDAPEANFDTFFAEPSGTYRTAPSLTAEEAELDLDTTGEEFEFSLDD